MQERKQKLLSRNLESVFCLSISKSQGEVRKLDSAWRYLDLEICPGSKIRGEARNLDSGWPAPVLRNCPVLQNPERGVESGIWMARAGSWKLVTVPPCVFANRYRYFLFLVSWELGILESGNCVHFTGTACMHVSRNAKGPSNVARPPARATAWPERASLQRAPRAARHRVGARSHPRRTG